MSVDTAPFLTLINMTLYDILTAEELALGTDHIPVYLTREVEDLTYSDLQGLAYFWGITTVAALERLEERILEKGQEV